MNLFDMIAKSYSEVRSKLELPVQGTAAHDAAAVGNPVQVGGVYRATDPAVADGDVVSFRLNAKGEAIIQLAGSKTGKQASDTITRPADTTAYAAGDVVSTTAGEILDFASVGAAGDLIVILGSRLRVDVAAVPAGCVGYRLHLYNAAPAAIADNAAYDLPETDRAKYLGYITLSTPIDNGATLWSQDDGTNFTCKLAGTGLFGILQTIGAYTPSSAAVKTVILNTAGV